MLSNIIFFFTSNRHAIPFLFLLLTTTATQATRMPGSSAFASPPQLSTSLIDITANDIEKEVTRMHTFFVAWFKAEIENTEEAFQVAPDSMADTFSLITPGGTFMERTGLLQALKDGYGSRKGPDAYKIQCRQVRILQKFESTVLAAYEEWQTVGDTETARLTSAWYRIVDKTKKHPLGLQWLHVHETWLPGKEPVSADKMWNPPTRNTDDDEVKQCKE